MPNLKLETLQNLYLHELQDLHSGEVQIMAALPDIIRAASSRDLKEALRTHLIATRKQRERLEEILRRHDLLPRSGGTCHGMQGLLKECENLLKLDGDELVKDLSIISACQRVEHYEMAGYGNARAFAEQLGHYDDYALLTETIEEESAADDELTSAAALLLSDCAEGALH